MIKKVWNVLIIIILLLAAVWLLLFAANRSLARDKMPVTATAGQTQAGKNSIPAKGLTTTTTVQVTQSSTKK